MEKKPWHRKKRIVIPLSILLVSVAASILDGAKKAETSSLAQAGSVAINPETSATSSGSALLQTKKSRPSSIATGQSQRQFLALIEDARNQWKSAQTDLQQSEVLRNRDDALCEVLENRMARNWIGQISAIGANGEGKAWVEIAVGPDVRFVTWNNAVSDLGDGTLIARGSSLFQRLTRFAEGDEVQFSARLSRGDSTCLRKTNLTEAFYIMDPKLLMHLTDVRGL